MRLTLVKLDDRNMSQLTHDNAYKANIVLNVNYDDSLEKILKNLKGNTITKLYNRYKQEIPLSYHVRGDITFYY